MCSCLCAVVHRCPAVSPPRSINLKKLDGNSNVEVLAQNIIDKCELIHASRLPRLIELLSDMQMHVVEEERKVAEPDVRT